MEEMNIEQTVEIPDTPDRRQFNYGVGRRDNGPISNFPAWNNSHLNHGPANGIMHHTSKPSLVSGGAAHLPNSNSVSSSRRNDNWNRATLFRKTAPNGVRSEIGNPTSAFEKNTRKSAPFRAPEQVGKDPVVDVRKGKGIEVASRTDAPRCSLSECVRYDSKGKSIVGNDDRDCSMPIVPRRTSENRRLVRNGCISPNNIARRTPTQNGSSETSPIGSELRIGVLNVESSEERDSNRSKGKGVIESVDSENGVNCQDTNSISSLLDIVSSQERSFMNRRDTKRRRVNFASNNGECSTSNDDLFILGSSRRPPVYRRLDEQETMHFPEFYASTNDAVIIDDSKAKSDQLEADERLARQLQEEFYNEVDENPPSNPQRNGNIFNSNAPSRTISRRPRNAPAGNPQRQPASTRRYLNRPTRAFSGRHRSVSRNYPSSSRYRSNGAADVPPLEPFEFPFEMDLDMRLEVLEALEAADVNFNVLDFVSANHLLNVDRDFNENDYDVLSSLDDRIGGKKGLSAEQIRSLPESVVQVEGGDDQCTICLETHSKGDKIRHLVCMHKFHKDCIDVWLAKNKLCPICKSSAL